MNRCAMFAAIPIALVVAGANAGQFGLDFAHYAGYSTSHGSDPLNSFSLAIETDETSGRVDLTFSMNDHAGYASIRSIWFEDGSELGDIIAINDTGRVDMRENRGSNNPASRRDIDWEGTDHRVGRKGSWSNGVGAGESMTISFQADDDFFQGGLDALMSGEARIAFQMEGLGWWCNKSAYYTSIGGSEYLNAVPLPSAGAMAGLVLVASAGRRRRR